MDIWPGGGGLPDTSGPQGECHHPCQLPPGLSPLVLRRPIRQPQLHANNHCGTQAINQQQLAARSSALGQIKSSQSYFSMHPHVCHKTRDNSYFSFFPPALTTTPLSGHVQSPSSHHCLPGDGKRSRGRCCGRTLMRRPHMTPKSVLGPSFSPPPSTTATFLSSERAPCLLTLSILLPWYRRVHPVSARCSNWQPSPLLYTAT